MNKHTSMSTRTGLIRRVDDTGVPLLLARLVVGGMFAYLAYNKIIDPIEFLKQTRAYGVVPEQPPWLNVTAIVVPWLELVCAVVLILGVYIRGAAATLLAMLLLFAPLLLIRAYGIFTDPANAGVYGSFCDVKFDCGCGTGEVFICSKMLENTALMLGALIALFSRSRRFRLPALLAKRETPATQPAPAKS